MEANGPPPVSYALIKVANAITDGIMIADLMLIKLNLVRSTVQYKRTSSLQELKKIMEGNANE